MFHFVNDAGKQEWHFLKPALDENKGSRTGWPWKPECVVATHAGAGLPNVRTERRSSDRLHRTDACRSEDRRSLWALPREPDWPLLRHSGTIRPLKEAPFPLARMIHEVNHVFSKVVEVQFLDSKNRLCEDATKCRPHDVGVSPDEIGPSGGFLTSP